MTAGDTGAAVVPDWARIRFWGTRGTCPSPGAHTVRYGGNTSCIEVESASGAMLVLDAGTGIRALGDALLRRNGDGIRDTTDNPDRARTDVLHIVLSHRHGDHVLGLPHFAPLLSRTHTVCLHCGNSDADSLRPFVQSLLSPPLFPLLEGVTRHLDVCDWSDDHAVISDVMRVVRFPANHPGEASVLRVQIGARVALAYAPDNELAYSSNDLATIAWRTRLVDALRGVPVLIHDATYADSEIAQHAGWGHSSAEEATRFAMECGAEMLVLFHHHPDRSDDAVDAMERACQELAGGTLQVIAAREGDVLQV